MSPKHTKIFIPEIPHRWTERLRNGHTNIWNEGSTDTANPEVSLTPPQNGLYAERFTDGWYWVNGCATCENGVKTDSYIVCDNHNRCADCGTHHDDLTEIPNGTPRGFVCKPCYTKQHEKRRDMALQRAKNSRHSEYDCNERDEIICPECADAIDDDDGASDGDEQTCPTCQAVFAIHLSIKYSTTLIRKEEINHD